MSLQKIPEFHLIFLCGNFVERHIFRIVSGKSLKTMWTLCLSTKFPLQEIKWNYGIFLSVQSQITNLFLTILPTLRLIETSFDKSYVLCFILF